jgi:hypothetical protein
MGHLTRWAVVDQAGSQDAPVLGTGKGKQILYDQRIFGF